ncbi:RICIN domain-containing protein [Streptomyces sp. NBRC 110028]|uniref:RICIN domain-containing protein n=1 Tax=Streptomyces sp. NBRC 110028 TaxID=1621260 RepID=UPI000A3E0285|nr:RICIN domain-containing protein [Streptomyces sp. NBRC 110028]
MGSQGECEPGAVRSAGEFMALLRALKERSGLTYRQLESRAAERGEVLARSTLADALRQDALPRAETLVAFLRACGEEPRIGEWLEARERIATQQPPQSAPAQQPEAPPRPEAAERQVASGAADRPRRSIPKGRLIEVALAVLVVGAASLVVAMTADDDEPKTRDTTASSAEPASAAPAPGTYRIRSVISSLCLSELESQGGGNVFQTDCRSAIPTYALEGAQDSVYRIRSLHPALGYGCLGVGKASSEGGAQMMDDYCGHRGAAERFRIQRVTKPVRGYRIKPVHTGQCVSLPGGSTRKGDPVVQLPCTAGDTGQIFRFDPVRAPTAIPSITSN